MSKLNCEQARALLHDRHDDLISAAGSDALEAHLASCDACRGWTLQMERIQVALGDLREASRHVGERIERRAVLRRPAPMWRRMRIAAALLLACGGTLAAWRIMATARSGEHVRAPLAPPTARNDSDANDVAAAPLPGTRNTADTAVPPGAVPFENILRTLPDGAASHSL
jgi:anti-sigma factor RsiW